jgi:hypothetical protein
MLVVWKCTPFALRYVQNRSLSGNREIGGQSKLLVEHHAIGRIVFFKMLYHPLSPSVDNGEFVAMF